MFAQRPTIGALLNNENCENESEIISLKNQILSSVCQREKRWARRVRARSYAKRNRVHSDSAARFLWPLSARFDILTTSLWREKKRSATGILYAIEYYYSIESVDLCRRDLIG